MLKVLFVINNFDIGGTRSSLINLLSELSSKQDIDIDITLFALSHSGPYLAEVPNGVDIVPEKKYISNCLPKGNKTLLDSAYHVTFHVYKAVVGYRKSLAPLFIKAAKEILAKYGVFDAVVGYQEGITNYFSSFIHAKKHFVWVHSDIDKWFDESVFVKDVYYKATNIIFVADASRAKFCNYFPEFTDKSIIIKNTISVNAILAKSEQIKDVGFEQNVTNIISVGRIVEAKAFNRVVSVGKRLKEDGLSYKWRIIGDGPLFSTLKNSVIESNLENNVILLGSLSNPYPYIKRSDLLVVTSINENQPMVILEALSLGIPVLTTRYDSALELINDEGYGIICENNEEAIYKSLIAILSSKDTMKKMSIAANSYMVDNSPVINRIIRLFED